MDGPNRAVRHIEAGEGGEAAGGREPTSGWVQTTLRLTVVFGITEKSVRSSLEFILERLQVSMSGPSTVQSEGGRACPMARLARRLGSITVRRPVIVLSHYNPFMFQICFTAVSHVRSHRSSRSD